MVLEIIGCVFIALAVIILYIDLESVKRKEEELERETKEMEIRLRDIERCYVDDVFDRNKGQHNRISADETVFGRVCK